MKTKLLLTAAAILWGTLHTYAATAEPDADAKKQYTRTLYTQNQETIQERARICGGIHDMYAMLALLHVNVLKPTVTWNVVDFLLQTAGHWGWGTSKTASAAETLIYREAAICRFWEEPKLTVAPTAPNFLQQVKADAMVFHRINDGIQLTNTKIDFDCLARYRRAIFGSIIQFTASGTSVDFKTYQSVPLYEKGVCKFANIRSYDLLVLMEYTNYSVNETSEKANTSTAQCQEQHKCYQILSIPHNFVLLDYFISEMSPICNANTNKHWWHGVICVDAKLINIAGSTPYLIEHTPSGVSIITTDRKRCTPESGTFSFHNENREVTIHPNMSPLEFYRSLREMGCTIRRIEPPVLMLAMTQRTQDNFQCSTQ